MKRSSVRLIAVFSTLAVTAIAVQHSAAQPEDRFVDISPPSDDIPLLAEDLEISHNEAELWTEGENEFLEALTAAKARAGGQYFSSAWTPQSERSTGHKAWVSFEGTVSDDIRGLFEDLPLAVDVREDAKHSESELESVREEVMHNLHATGKLNGLAGNFSKEGGIEMTYDPSGSPPLDSADFHKITSVSDQAERESKVDIYLRPSPNSAPVEQ